MQFVDGEEVKKYKKGDGGKISFLQQSDGPLKKVQFGDGGKFSFSKKSSGPLKKLTGFLAKVLLLELF